MPRDDQLPQDRDETRMTQGETQQDVPRMPHERDESGDSQAKASPSHERMADKARKDVERGVVDTTKGAELDATYEQVKDGDKQFRP
jgi:hypothetical protein